MRAPREKSASLMANSGHALVQAVVLAVVALAPACASAQGRESPLPPPRPTTLGPPAAPSTTPSTPPAPAPVDLQAPLDPDHPPMLPQASRARMRECGRAWEAVKKAGKDVDIGWRAYATDCLSR
jgi:hypothetical protein